jgi:hypothetical protein
MSPVKEALKKIKEARTGLLFAASAIGALAGPEAPLSPPPLHQEALQAPGSSQTIQKPSTARSSAQEVVGGLREATLRLANLTLR